MLKRKHITLTIAFSALLLFCTILFAFYNLVKHDLSLQKNEQAPIMGAVYMTLNNPFYQIIDNDLRSRIEKNGGILLSRNPSLHADRQAEEIQELIDRKAKVIFLNPVDAAQIEPTLQKAKAANIPIIVIDSNVEHDELVACTIVSDNFLAGVQCAEHLVQNSSGGKVALLTHSRAQSARDRIDGFLSVIQKHPQFEVVDQEDCLGQLELAMPAMEKMLQRHPEINVIMALNDPTAMGAVAALQNAGRLADTAVYGVDGSPDVKEMIANGMITATAGQQPLQMSEKAMIIANKIFAGESVPPIIKLPTVLFTKENIAEMNYIGY